MSREHKLWKAVEHLNESLHEQTIYTNVVQGSKVGYCEDESEARLDQVAESVGVTLIRNPDGSHLAIDESHMTGDRTA